MYKTILVPIDIAHLKEGKENIDRAAQHAAVGAKVILLNVVEDIPTWASVELPAGLVDKNVEAAKSELETAAREAGIAVEIEVRTGHSYNTILEVAEQRNADLIIIASHRPGIKDYFIGSTAARVVRHADCSVLVVR